MVAVSSTQFPRGNSEKALEEFRVKMVLEMKKVHKDLAAINHCMGKTFASRRNEIVSSSPAITTVESRWPALFLQAQNCAEFKQITNRNLLQLLNLSREKQFGKFGHHLSAILKMYDTNVQAKDVSILRTAAIHCLPALLDECDSEVFKVCEEAELRTLESSDCPICILSIAPKDEEGNVLFLQPSPVYIILEGRMVTSSL
ncbi:uncharacterized protein LOC124871647 [Girardinichthys multiradiatus]|uniref:uncharacterized protein LOC124871647 n=1 Tax=Girardinichthys multiradiatus TaxID=208333 RepID=UPI001FAB9D58|nr:uncharacterized protein LOC124871647 [Girardinichthys multiradiatus]